MLEIRTHWLEKQVKEVEDKANQVKVLGDPAWKKRMFFGSVHFWDSLKDR